MPTRLCGMFTCVAVITKMVLRAQQFHNMHRLFTAKTSAAYRPAYIEPTEFDPLRDEAYDYGRALEAAGIEVEIVEAKGAVHGYEFVDCETTRKYQKLRVEALKKFLA